VTMTPTSTTVPDITSNTWGTRDISSAREESGLADLEGLSLDDLATLANREIDDSRRLQSEAVGLSRRSTAAFYRAGRTLWCARKKLKGKGKRAWTKWQKANGIPTTSAWQAIRLYEEAESEEAVAGLTRTQALKKYDVTKPKKDRPQQAPVEGGKPVAEGAEPAEVGGAVAEDVSVESPDLRLAPERDGEAGGTTPDQDAEAGLAEQVEESQADPTMPPAAETLLHVVRRLEILERDVRGGQLGDEAHALIEQAIATLRRLRGDVPPATEAA
jgi:hypothetical protein